MSEIIDNYHNVQQDVMETFIDRGQLRKLAEPTILSNGRRIPGLKLDHPWQLAVMHSLVRFANVAAGGQFTTADLYIPALEALGNTEAEYSLASFRYDLSKLRAKRLVEKIPHSRRYRLVGKGYSICVAFLKLFEKIYAPLTAGLLQPFRGESRVGGGETLHTRSPLPTCQRRFGRTLQAHRPQSCRLMAGNEHEILVARPITATNAESTASCLTRRLPVYRGSIR